MSPGSSIRLTGLPMVPNLVFGANQHGGCPTSTCLGIGETTKNLKTTPVEKTLMAIGVVRPADGLVPGWRAAGRDALARRDAAPAPRSPKPKLQPSQESNASSFLAPSVGGFWECIVIGMRAAVSRGSAEPLPPNEHRKCMAPPVHCCACAAHNTIRSSPTLEVSTGVHVF